MKSKLNNNQNSLLLERKVQHLKKLFPTESIVSLTPTKDSIQKYYKINQLAYTLFHQGNDFIHMGISRNGKYNKKDLLEPVHIIEKYIVLADAKKILELATGRGANSAYLAKRHPKITFSGIDLPHGQLSYALNKAKKIPNFHPIPGDYHDLSNFPDNSFDLVFIIEALCYSTEKDVVLKEVQRVLKPEGIFIIIDGYLKKPHSSLSEIEKLANSLVARGMMVPDFELYSDFKKNTFNLKYKILFEEDVSKLLLPTVERFEKQTQFLFKLPIPIAKFLIKLFPKEFVNNILAAALLPTLIRLDVADYEILVLQKSAFNSTKKHR